MSDPDVDNLLERLAGIYSRNNDFHYLLIEKGRYNELDKKRLALDKRIFTIEYENNDGNHKEVYEFLSHLKDLTNIHGKYRQEYINKFNIKNIDQKQSKKISVFISYGGQDSKTAKDISKILYENGIEVWMDDINVKVGDTIISKIESGIKDSDYFIVLISNHSIKSHWVKQEIEIAYITNQDRNKPKMIPIVYEDIDIENIPKFIRQIAWLKVSEKNLNQQILLLVNQLKNLE